MSIGRICCTSFYTIFFLSLNLYFNLSILVKLTDESDSMGLRVNNGDAGCDYITKLKLLCSLFLNHVRRAPVQAKLCEIG